MTYSTAVLLTRRQTPYSAGWVCRPPEASGGWEGSAGPTLPVPPQPGQTRKSLAQPGVFNRLINRLFRPSGCRLTAGNHNQPSGRHVWLLNHSTTTSLGHKVVIGYVLAPQACRSPPAFPARCAWRVSRSAAERRAAGACAGWASSGQCCAAAPWTSVGSFRQADGRNRSG